MTCGGRPGSSAGCLLAVLSVVEVCGLASVLSCILFLLAVRVVAGGVVLVRDCLHACALLPGLRACDYLMRMCGTCR